MHHDKASNGEAESTDEDTRLNLFLQRNSFEFLRGLLHEMSHTTYRLRWIEERLRRSLEIEGGGTVRNIHVAQSLIDLGFTSRTNFELLEIMTDLVIGEIRRTDRQTAHPGRVVRDILKRFRRYAENNRIVFELEESADQIPPFERYYLEACIRIALMVMMDAAHDRRESKIKIRTFLNELYLFIELRAFQHNRKGDERLLNINFSGKEAMRSKLDLSLLADVVRGRLGGEVEIDLDGLAKMTLVLPLERAGSYDES